MKNFALLLIAAAIVTSFGCYAQKNDRVTNNPKNPNIQSTSDQIANNDLAVVSYHVEERINVALGSNITTYDVTNLSLVNTNDLGQNNSRIVTPKYGKTKPIVAENETPKAIVAVASVAVKPKKVEAAPIAVKEKSVSINITNTYERVLDKGYKSVDMLKKVADSHYFEGDLTLAAKWYSELFDINNDPNLDAVYYFRYAQSLKSVGQTEKSNQMMTIFESKSLEK